MAEEFIFKWQTIIGSFFGPFLAVILSAVGFFIRGKLKKRKDRKEATRRAEIAFSQTLNYIFTSAIELKDFIKRVRTLISDIEKITNPNEYAVHETNYPPLINIYFDKDLSKMKFKSPYLHNKILTTEYIVRWINSGFIQFEIDFDKLIKKNMLMTEKMKPEDQRQAFAKNLTGYIEMIEKLSSSLKEKYAKSIIQAKVYNLKLMKDHFKTIWKYERTSLKYFKNKKEIEKHNGSLKVVDRIDDLMEEDANKLYAEVEKRAEE